MSTIGEIRTVRAESINTPKIILIENPFEIIIAENKMLDSESYNKRYRISEFYESL